MESGLNYENPAAFPSDPNCGFSGMTLRDYFAAKALAAILTHEKNIVCLAINKGGPEAIACDSYVMADAMLKARSK